MRPVPSLRGIDGPSRASHPDVIDGNDLSLPEFMPASAGTGPVLSLGKSQGIASVGATEGSSSAQRLPRDSIPGPGRLARSQVPDYPQPVDRQASAVFRVPGNPPEVKGLQSHVEEEFEKQLDRMVAQAQAGARLQEFRTRMHRLLDQFRRGEIGTRALLARRRQTPLEGELRAAIAELAAYSPQIQINELRELIRALGGTVAKNPNDARRMAARILDTAVRPALVALPIAFNRILAGERIELYETITAQLNRH